MTQGAIMFRLNLIKEDGSIKIVNPRYTKIFTQRPDIVKGKPYKVIPCDSTYIQSNISNLKLKESIKIFNQETDKLFKKHNKGNISEYFFFKKRKDSCINEK